MPKERYTLILEDAGDDVNSAPPEVRVRHLLKIALRGLSLRCVSINQPDPQPVTMSPVDAPNVK